MGRADEYQFDYLDDNTRFADQVNGALFHGRQVVKPDELEPADSQAVFLGKEAGRRKNYKAIADKVRVWRGKLIHILAIENQTFVDYHIREENKMMEKSEEKYGLCKAFVDMKLEGIMEGKKEGRREHLIQTVCIKLRKNKPANVIAEELEEELSEIEKVIAAQKRVGSYDVEQICLAMME